MPEALLRQCGGAVAGIVQRCHGVLCDLLDGALDHLADDKGKKTPRIGKSKI